MKNSALIGFLLVVSFVFPRFCLAEWYNCADGTMQDSPCKNPAVYNQVSQDGVLQGELPEQVTGRAVISNTGSQQVTPQIDSSGSAVLFDTGGMPLGEERRDKDGLFIPVNNTGPGNRHSLVRPPAAASPPASDLGAQNRPCVPTEDKPCPVPSEPVRSQQVGQDQNQQKDGGLDTSYAQQAERDLDACREQVSRTKRCCTNPVACMTSGGVQDAYNTLSALAAVGADVMMGTSGGDPKKLQQACSVMQALGYGSGAANAGLAGVCYSEISSCEDKCDRIKTQYQAYINENCSGGAPCASSVKSRIQSAISSAKSASNSCSAMNGQVQMMATQAVAGGLSGAFGGLCANISTATATPPSMLPVTNTDCSNPANAGNPICLNCSNPANASNPLCPKLGNQGLGDGSGVSLAGNPNFGAGSASQNNVGANAGFDGNSQKGVTGGGQFKPASSGGVPNGGGQMLGGNSSGNNSFGIPDRSQQGGGRGYNTDVMQGTGGGGGYSVSSAPVAAGGGGFGGYGQQDEKRNAKPFDLRNYLPGGTKDPKRGIAGIGSPTPEIGNRYVDIFQRVHDRYAALCRLERMLECGRKK